MRYVIIPSQNHRYDNHFQEARIPSTRCDDIVLDDHKKPGERRNAWRFSSRYSAVKSVIMNYVPRCYCYDH